MADVYTLKFIWEEKDGKLRAIYCDEQDVPKDTGAGSLVDTYVQWTFNELSSNYEFLDQYASSVTVNKKQSVRMPRGRFLYMDVGCWLNGKQSFGMVCGNDAVLCDYNPGAGGGSKPTTSGLINEVLDIPGVSVRSWKKIVGPCPTNTNRLLIVLPDMHVPAAPPLGMAPPIRPPDWTDLTTGNWREDPRTFAAANKLDFFNSRPSISAMITFLKALRERLSSEVALVQLGDMYELWAGHSLQYVQTPKAEVVLKDNWSARTVGSWIGTIHDMHQDLFEQFDLWDSRSNTLTVFLHGNHDSYLSLPEVVAEANKYIKSSHSSIMEGGYEREWFKETKVYPRLRSLNLEGVFIEHGQRTDGPNRDGSTVGWEKTNEAYESIGMWKKKVGDTTRRPSFVTGAATQWVVQEKNFGLYVQGHTHDPDLRYVEVLHQRGSINYSGGKIVITTTGEL